MKIPVQWLRSYIDLPPKLVDLAEALTMSGTAIEGITQKKDSDVLHAEITTNRPDCLSLLGIAQEVSAVTGKKIKRQAPGDIRLPSKHRLPLQIDVRDKKDCPRYLGRAFDSVHVESSPPWLLHHLDWVDQKGVNTIVDITNFCLYETGQPLHAFDYDKVKGAKIVVRRARKGETIRAINEVEYALDERLLVIADAQKPIAIAGVMGGLDTEVNSHTKRVILESAQFDPVLIRRAARLLKLQSESSYRFERGIDPQGIKTASLRASDLFVKLAGAVPASQLIEGGSGTLPKGFWMKLRLNRLNAVLGTVIPKERAARILGSLGFKVKTGSKTELRVKSLIQRPDVRREIDLIEEIARLYGFHKIPETMPATARETLSVASDEKYRTLRQLKKFLASRGMYETVTFSLLSHRSLLNAGFGENGKPVIVKNPLSQEQEVLRPSGLVGLLDAVARNISRKEKDLAFFEVAKRFLKEREDTVLSLALTGDIQTSWQGRRTSSFYYLKGILENCLECLRKETPAWREEAYLSETFSENLSLFYGDKRIGHCSTVLPSIAERWDIKQPVFFAELNLDEVLKGRERKRTFTPPAKFPPVRRDIAFIVSKHISAQAIGEAMAAEGAPFLRDVCLFDQFVGGAIPQGKRSLAFALEYQKPDGTFTDEEIRSIHQKVSAALVKKFQAELR